MTKLNSIYLLSILSFIFTIYLFVRLEKVKDYNKDILTSKLRTDSILKKDSVKTVIILNKIDSLNTVINKISIKINSQAIKAKKYEKTIDSINKSVYLPNY